MTLSGGGRKPLAPEAAYAVNSTVESDEEDSYTVQYNNIALCMYDMWSTTVPLSTVFQTDVCVESVPGAA
jgi:hypothetical protein